MLESIWIILLILAIVLMVISIAWESLVISLIDSILWFVLAIGAFETEIPYQYTTGSTVTEATQSVFNNIGIVYLMMMIGVVMFIYWIFQVLNVLRDNRSMTRGI